MRDYQVDPDGAPLTSLKCQQILECAKAEVKEVMSVIAVAKMVLADARGKQMPLAIQDSSSTHGNCGFPAMSSNGNV